MKTDRANEIDEGGSNAELCIVYFSICLYLACVCGALLLELDHDAAL